MSRMLGIVLGSSARPQAARSRADRRPPRSPVRMRTQSSSGSTKILPSPIWPVSPVRAAWTIASTVASTNASLTAISSFNFGSRRTWNSVPRYTSV